jgi:hypothetical protein
MSEQQSPPPLEATATSPSFGVELDEAELSDDDLEHVVGGLARAWPLPGEQASSEGDGGTGAHLGLNV